MTPTQLEILAQLKARLGYVQDRIAFHDKTHKMLIAEAASVKNDIDAIQEMGEGELVLAWNVNEANEGQD